MFTAHQLAGACDAFLKGLARAPDDAYCDRGFMEAATRFKYVPVQRWARWPFVPIEEVVETGRHVTEPPAPIGPPVLLRATPRSVLVGWDAYEPRIDVPYDCADGYQVETAHLCPLDGQAAWVRAYRGRNTKVELSGLNETRDILVRIRPYNRKGCPEWSAVRCFHVAMPPRPEPVELDSMPMTWWGIDIDDLAKQERLADGSRALERAMEALFTTMHAHRSALKIAFRYYSLIGATAASLEAGGLMTATQFVNFVKASPGHPCSV